MEKIIKELKEIWDSEENALRCGGTYSSMNLRKCLDLITKIEDHKEHPKYKNVLDHLTKIREVWRKALKKHNSQKLKVLEYDINTGLPIKGNNM